MAAITANIPCPKCKAMGMWDNRTSKRNPGAPDFKCKDRACDGVIWPPKGSATAAAAPAPSATTGYSAGPHIPGIDDEQTQAPVRLGLFATYDKCLDHVLNKVVPKLAQSDVGASPESVAAIVATLFIAAKERGVAA